VGRDEQFGYQMSIIEHDIQFVERPVDAFPPDGEDDNLYWFSTSFLRSVNRHPLDDTIQYTGARTCYVRWFDRDSDQRHDDSTASVTSIVPHESIRGPSEVRHAATTTTSSDNRRTDGIRMHRWIECVLNGLPMTTDTRLKQQFSQYYYTCIHTLLVPWRTEMVIRSASDIRLIGVVDALFISDRQTTDGTLHLRLKDWKYSPDVLSCLEDYVLQLNLYKFILESHYTDIPFEVNGIVYNRLRVETMELVVFHETLPSYQIHIVPDIQTAVYELMHKRKNDLERVSK